MFFSDILIVKSTSLWTKVLNIIKCVADGVLAPLDFSGEQPQERHGAEFSQPTVILAFKSTVLWTKVGLFNYFYILF